MMENYLNLFVFIFDYVERKGFFFLWFDYMDYGRLIFVFNW